MAKPSFSLRYLVDVRAGGCCEYCRRYKVMTGAMFFEIEHILPRALGGSTDPANLAFACRRCNLLKSDKIAAIDPRTNRLAPLFNPRLDRWLAHFRRSRDQLRIYGRTATGRATVDLLQFNEEGEQQVRRIQRDYLSSFFPLDGVRGCSPPPVLSLDSPLVVQAQIVSTCQRHLFLDQEITNGAVRPLGEGQRPARFVGRAAAHLVGAWRHWFVCGKAGTLLGR